MSEKELSKYFELKREVKDLEERIENVDKLEESLTKVELVSLLTEKRISALEQYLEIERFIEQVEDVELRNIMRYRFLDLYTWDMIADLMYMDRSTVSKKVKRYLQ
ncbi:MAG: hypothetical protein II006_03390 [Peptostreptococcaceae bacterium]|nr:hypothetical protein [Peptostreptococcaceae bacterium]